jgi:hypothetical protein
MVDAREILQPGTNIQLLKYKRADGMKGRRAGYRRAGQYTVESINERMIRLRKDTGYIETVNVFDLRQKLYKLLLEDGAEVSFPPMIDHMKAERGHLDRYIADMSSEGKKKGEKVMSKKINIDHEKLLGICREHGTGKAGYKAVAESLGITERQAETVIYRQKIRQELAAEKAVAQREAAEVVKEAVKEERIAEASPAVKEPKLPEESMEEEITNAQLPDILEPGAGDISGPYRCVKGDQRTN